MTFSEIYAELKRIAPDVAFAAVAIPDPYFVWDGDGPDPADDGFMACDAKVTARAISDGEMVEGSDYLGGHYVADGEAIGDIAGYLPQMLAEAADELAGLLRTESPVQAQLSAVSAFLAQEMADRYNEQRAEIEASRGK